jgi:predicted membrane chloride channel (bestrophin family)
VLDPEILLTTLLGSGVVVAAASYVLRRYFDRTLDIRMTAIQEQNTAILTEMSRRRAVVYDQLFDVLRTAASLVYRARNFARDINAHPEHIDRKQPRERLEGLKAYQTAIEELLYEQRSLLPDSIFRNLHDMKGYLQGFIVRVEMYRRYKHSEGERSTQLRDIQREMTTFFQHLDTQYAVLAEIIQKHLSSDVSRD